MLPTTIDSGDEKQTELCTMAYTHIQKTLTKDTAGHTHTLCQLEGQSVSLRVCVCDYVFLSVCLHMYDCVCPCVSGK